MLFLSRNIFCRIWLIVQSIDQRQHELNSHQNMYKTLYEDYCNMKKKSVVTMFESLKKLPNLTKLFFSYKISSDDSLVELKPESFLCHSNLEQLYLSTSSFIKATFKWSKIGTMGQISVYSHLWEDSLISLWVLVGLVRLLLSDQIRHHELSSLRHPSSAWVPKSRHHWRGWRSLDILLSEDASLEISWSGPDWNQRSRLC